MRAGLPAVAAGLVCAGLLGACGLGPGEASEGEATLTVTRDYGAERLLEASEADPPESETVIRMLDRELEITTRYGGGFVESIDGISGGYSGGRSSDWFFFVNGIESPRGSAEVGVGGGDRIWWDYRDWTDAISTPAVVGSWPEPFAQASTDPDERLDVGVDCRGGADACGLVRERLSEAGVEVGDGGLPAGAGPRLLVGPWGAIRSDPVARELGGGPGQSGVFARFERSGDGWRLIALDSAAEPARALAAGGGLVAGLRPGDEPATWIVTGTDAAGTEAAAALLDTAHLRDRYALAASGEDELALPLGSGG